MFFLFVSYECKPLTLLAVFCNPKFKRNKQVLSSVETNVHWWEALIKTQLPSNNKSVVLYTDQNKKSSWENRYDGPLKNKADLHFMVEIKIALINGCFIQVICDAMVQEGAESIVVTETMEDNPTLKLLSSWKNFLITLIAQMVLLELVSVISYICLKKFLCCFWEFLSK